VADIIREYETQRHPYPEEFRWQGPNDAVADLVYLLQRQPALAQELRRWSLYLVDEWHDVNAAEFELLARLRRGARLVVAGDKDQTINRDRGADPVFSGQRFLDMPTARTASASRWGCPTASARTPPCWPTA
jgi:DNA helicase-2/ATP-dependent DNA helicase PcrA